MPFVLVHGGGFAGSSWDLLAPLLANPVHVVDLPGRGNRPADLTQVTVADFVREVEHEIIANDLTEVALVGHSLAGITLPGVAARVPDRLRRLVFIACAVPTDGQTIADVLPGIGRGRRSDGRRRITGHGTLHHEVAARMFCNDMDHDQTAFTLERLVPEADLVITEPVDLRGLQYPIPRTYIRLLRDASIIPAAQDKMITNLGGAEVIDLDAGHMAMISQPAQLADMLNAL